MSANTGVAPARQMTSTVATNVNGVVMTSSPGPMPSARSASSRASVPELTPRPYFAPQSAAICFSSSATLSPRPNWHFART